MFMDQYVNDNPLRHKHASFFGKLHGYMSGVVLQFEKTLQSQTQKIFLDVVFF